MKNGRKSQSSFRRTYLYNELNEKQILEPGRYFGKLSSAKRQVQDRSCISYVSMGGIQ